MGWIETLFGTPRTTDSETDAEARTETVRKISRELEELPADRAKYVAAFAYVLGRVAYADHVVSDEETRTMEEIVREEGELPGDQAALAVEIAKSQYRLFGGTESFLVTREFRESTTLEDRRHLLDSLFAVSAADDSISGEEEAVVRQIASELGFSHADFVAARSEWSDKRSVIQSLWNRDDG